MSAPTAPKLTPEEKAAKKAENIARIQGEVDGMLGLDASTLAFPQCLEWHGKLRGKIVEMQTLSIQGLFDFKVVRELEPKIVAKIHQVEERAHALQGGTAAVPGKADRTK